MGCLDHISSNVQIAKLPCKHTFHAECLRNWAKTNPTCPFCRRPLPMVHHRSHPRAMTLIALTMFVTIIPAATTIAISVLFGILFQDWRIVMMLPMIFGTYGALLLLTALLVERVVVRPAMQPILPRLDPVIFQISTQQIGEAEGSINSI